MKNIFLYKLLILASALLAGCGGNKKVDTDRILSELDSINTINEAPEIDNEMVAAILQSVPSPLEISFLIKETGSEYNQNYLNSPSNVSKYSSSYDKAINLGIYGADLAYSNIFENSQDGIFYLDAVTELANQLNIGQFFDYQILKSLIKHNDNLDSLLLITTSNFERINLYLQEQNRSQLSSLFLYGGWVEGLNLLCEVYEDTKNTDIKERIGEQKIVLSQIIQLLGYFEYDPNIKPLVEQLRKIQEVYSEVNIETIEGDTSFEIIDGVMMAVTNSETMVHISDETLQKIITTLNEIRAKVTKS